VSGLSRHVICLDKKTGQILWDKGFPGAATEDPWQGNIREHGYTSNTPITDGQHVFVHFGKGGVAALDFQGNVLWQSPTGTDSNRMRWGSAGSPVLWKNLFIVNASDEAQALIAFDTATGKEVWRQKAAPLAMAFSSPRLLTRDAGREDLLFSAPGELWGLNPANGKLRWFFETGLNGNVSPDPTVIGDEVIVFGGSPSTGRVAVKLGLSGEVSQSDVLWRNNSSTYIPSPLTYQGRLYTVNDQGFFSCTDAKTGEDLFRERLNAGANATAAPSANGDGRGGRGGNRGGGRGKPIYASPIRVQDRIYAQTRRQGVVVLDAAPTFKVLATNKFSDDTTDFNATPAVSDGNLLLRSNKALYCVGLDGRGH